MGRNYYIRWMLQKDMPEVFAIDSRSFEFPWSEEDFVSCLRKRNCIGMVAEYEERVVGFMVYELNKTRIRVPNFAVAPDMRRKGVGSAMVDKLVGKLSVRRRQIVLELRESNLPAQKFFRSQGFRAVAILRDFYQETHEDAYVMRRRYRPQGQNNQPVLIGGEACSEEC